MLAHRSKQGNGRSPSWAERGVKHATPGWASSRRRSLAAFHSLRSAHSDDGGKTWTNQLVSDAGQLHDGSEIFADLTPDNQGNPYIGYVMNLKTEYDVWVEATFDGGTTWNGKTDGTGRPYQVNTDTATHFFAAIAAGNPGQVDVANPTSRQVTPTPTGTSLGTVEEPAQRLAHLHQPEVDSDGHTPFARWASSVPRCLETTAT